MLSNTVNLILKWHPTTKGLSPSIKETVSDVSWPELTATPSSYIQVPNWHHPTVSPTEPQRRNFDESLLDHQSHSFAYTHDKHVVIVLKTVVTPMLSKHIASSDGMQDPVSLLILTDFQALRPVV